MKKDQTIQSYRKHAGVAIRNWVKGRRRRRVPPFLRGLVGSFAHFVTFRSRVRVLDVGCGPGLDSVFFARAGYEVVGLDAVPEFLEYARRHARSSHVRGRIKYVVADISRMRIGKPPLDLKSFDLLWANASLIHLRKKKLTGILRRLSALLIPGGVLAATFFHGKGEGVYHGSFVPGRFFARYLKKELHQKFARSGWTVQSIRAVANEDRKGRWLNVVAVPAR